MKIKESGESRRNQFASLLRQYAPDLVRLDDHHGNVFYFYDSKNPDHIVRVERTNQAERGWFTRLFYDGEWEDIIVSVRDGTYFEGVCQFAQKYEALTQTKIVVQKEF